VTPRPEVRPVRRNRIGAWTGAIALLACCWPRIAWAAGGLTDEAFSRIIVLLGAVGVAYGITHLAVERLARRFSFAGGIEYVALGLVLGPLLHILEPALIRDLRPILLLGAGALGMLAGLELGLREEGARVRGAWAAAISITVFSGLIMIGLPLLGVWVFGPSYAGTLTAALLFVGVVALGSDGAVIRNLAITFGVEGDPVTLAEATANRVRALATVGFGVWFAVIHPGTDLQLRPWVGIAVTLGLQIGAGVILGLLFGVVIHRKLDERTLLTVVVGMVLLGGGFAYALDISGIFVDFIAGLTFTLTSPHAPDATRTMRSIKQPFVIALYFFAGLEWVFGAVWVYAMIIPFIGLRWIGRRLGGGLGARLSGSPTNLGSATAAPGGLTLAFVLSIGLVYREVPGIVDVYGPMVTALVLLELASIRAARRWLVDAAGLTSTPVISR
jgi:Kef-type K+ transport system membrane component KefB